MKRRELIAGMIAAAAGWPLAARAQQGRRLRRIGLLMGPAETDADGQARAKTFRDVMADLGWSHGRNVQLDHRWAGGDTSRAETYAAEFSNLGVDVIMANGTAQLAAAQRASKSIPVVFAQVSDPVGGGFVASIAHPGGNITGCTDFEYSFGVKWLETLKRIAPPTARAAVILDPSNPNSAKFLSPIQAAGLALGISVAAAPVTAPEDIERAVGPLAGGMPGGVIVLPSVAAIKYQHQIFAGVARHRLPAVYPYRTFAAAGGLASYGVDTFDMYRCAANYVNRILKGEKPADLPVQFATRFEFVINLKTARATGLSIPSAELLNATEVIE